MSAETLTDRLLAYLRDNDADFRVMTHPPVRTSAEAALVRGTALEQGAKALVCRADNEVVLVVLPAHMRLDGRAFKQAHKIKNLRMTSADELHELTGLEVGAVPPFGTLMGFPTYVDERLLQLPQIAFNAGSRSTSVLLNTADYVRLAQPMVGRFAVEQPDV